MNNKILFLLVFSFTLQVSGQEFMSYKESIPSPATNTWGFICENYALTGILNVQIAKTSVGGVLKLAIETTDPTYKISDTVYLDLFDNTIITCLDKGNREIIGNNIVTYYTFSTIEMNKLKKTDIQSIRFKIKGNSKGFNSQIGNFTAQNKKVYFSTSFDKTKKSFDTANEIKALYK